MQSVEVERQNTIPEIAGAWHLSRAKVRSLFTDVPGVLRITRPETRTKRTYESIRVPARIVRSVHQQLTKSNPKSIGGIYAE
jgi:hypothetical protein